MIADEPIPVNFYAKSKLLEKKTLKKTETLNYKNKLFGNGPIHRTSFSDVILNSLKNKCIYLFNDVIYTNTNK